MKSLVLLVVFGVITGMTCAQSFQYRAYTEEDGLSNNHVSCLAMDHLGFLWVGTHSGLNRFDGNAFEKFYNDPTDSNSIADNNIQKILVDRQNNLWIGTNAGLSLYHPETLKFNNYFPDTSVLPQPGISFQALCDDDSGNIWVGAKNDLLIFDPVRKKFSISGWMKYASDHSPANGNHSRVIILGLIRKNNKELWILSTYGLYSVNTETRIFNFFPYTKIPDYHGSELNYADKNENVWITTDYRGILCFQPAANKWTNYPVAPPLSGRNYAYSLSEYAGDTLMYSCSNFIGLLNAGTGKIYSPIRFEEDEGDLKNAEGKVILRSDKRLWLGTDKGLMKIMPSDKHLNFVPITRSENVERVFKLSFAKKLLFIGVSTGLTYVEEAKNKFKPITTPKRFLRHSYQYFVETHDGKCYLNDNQHFYQYNIKKNTAVDIPLPPKRNPGNDYDIRNMVEDKYGNIWIRTLSQGIMKYDALTKKLVMSTEIPLQGNRELNALYYDSLSNTIWVAEEFNGVYVYNIEKKRMQHFGLSKPPLQRNAAIIYILGDGRGNVWLCDVQSGLVRYNYSLNEFTRYTTYDGLTSNNCFMGAYDHHGFFWFATDIGLCKYDTLKKKFFSFTANEDFPVSSDTYLASDLEGNLYMPWKNGYYTWTGKELKDPVKNGSIYLRDILLRNKHLPAETHYDFSYAERNIQLLFGLLSYDTRNKIVLEYSLNGGSWVSADIHAYISFFNLTAGKYDLRVRVKNEAISPIIIHFLIERPFWQKWWFIAMLFLFIAVCAAALIRRRMNSLRKESSLRQKAVESEMSALRSQMNPHFIFNTLNSINSYIIDNKPDEASDYLGDFSRLMRIILEHSRKQTVTLNEELYALKLYLELEWRRLDRSFDYEIIIDHDLDTSVINIPPLVIQPYVENAIWHGLRRRSNGHINIGVKRHEKGILIIVEDDGIGRAASAKTEKVKTSQSFGTAATRQRVLLNDPGSKIEIEDMYGRGGEAEGTRVKIYLNHIKN